MDDTSEIIAIDTGTGPIVGILAVSDGAFTAYQDGQITKAIERIMCAREVIVYGGVTRDGKDYDLLQLGKFAGMDDELPYPGTYTDMRQICWPWAVWGSSLIGTYDRLFITCPDFSDTYQGAVERDCYMVWKIWERWKANTLNL